MSICRQCGSRGGEALCEELFDRLLALDHSRQPPWGPLHAVAAACFFLQHPAHRLAPSDRHAGWTLLQSYRTGGIPAVTALTASARNANSHRYPTDSQRPFAAHPPVPLPNRPPPTRFATTIVDVAVDGTFPGDGYIARLQHWTTATLTAWTASPADAP